MFTRRIAAVLTALFTVLLLGLGVAQAETGASLRPGDVLFISLPGEEALNKDFPVNRRGVIELPEVGELSVIGLRLDKARSLVGQRLATVFRGLSNFELALKERRKLVTVLGYVREPGQVDLPENATIQTAISAAGGLVPGAQLDRFQLRRAGGNKIFNFKRYLDSGDENVIPALASLDTVFVPASPLTGNVQVEFDARTLAEGGDAGESRTAVKIFGEVRTPGAYAYAEGQTAVDLLMRAGGVTRYASVEQIRVITGGEPLPFNLKDYLDSGNIAQLPKVGPGSTIFVPKEKVGVQKGARIVYVMGEVFKPGAFEMQGDSNFLDVLANSGGPTRFADTKRVRIIRAGGKVEPFDLSLFTETGGGEGIIPEVRPGDSIFIPEKLDQNEKSWLKVPPQRAVYVLGQVQRPGRYEWSDEMAFMDLLSHAGGPTSKADAGALRISNRTADGRMEAITFDLETFLKSGGKASDLPEIRAGATIMVPELPLDPTDSKNQWLRLGADRSIYVFGAVGAPGRYAFDPTLNLLDILSAADGPTPGADLHQVKITHRNQGGNRVSTMDLELFFQTGDEHLLVSVKPGDVIFVPERNRAWVDKKKEQTVRVLGSVNSAGRYTFSDEMTILDLLAEAGGPSANAMQDQIVVVNMSCCRDQAKTFDLVEFAKTGDVTLLPLVRPGDTVYVPDRSQGTWTKITSFAKDAGQLLALFALAGGL